MRKIILSQEQTDSIIKLYKSGLGQTRIYNQIGVNKSIIIRILNENNIPIIGTKRNSVDEAFFENIDSEEKAYWVGFLFADGYVRIRHNKYGELKLKLQSKDKEHIQLFKDAIKSTNVIKDIIERYPYKGEIKNASSSTFSIYSTKLVNDLISLGCIQNKSKLIKFPDKIPNNLIRHFIRGYFDGDGSVFLKKDNTIQFYICSGCEEFLEKIRDEFNLFGLVYQTIKKNVHNVFLLRSYRINDLKKINEYFYNDSKIYLNRKKEKIGRAHV